MPSMVEAQGLQHSWCRYAAGSGLETGQVVRESRESFTPSGADNRGVLDTDHPDAGEHELRFDRDILVALQGHVAPLGKDRHLVEFKTDAVTDELGLLSGRTHKAVAESGVGGHVVCKNEKVRSVSARAQGFDRSVLYRQRSVKVFPDRHGQVAITNILVISTMYPSNTRYRR